jgi:signal transduction histidine kinase/CheY-like chemotaxis protein
MPIPKKPSTTDKDEPPGDDAERRKQAEDSASRDALLQMAGRAARFGGWSVVLAEGRVVWSDEVAAIHDKPAGYSPTVEEGISFYAPEWRERIAEVFGACAGEGRPFEEEMEIITARGRRVWVRAIGMPIRDESGTITKVQGAFQDVTARKLTEADLKAAHDKLEALWGIASLVDADVKTISNHVLAAIARMFQSQYGFYGFVNADESIMTIHSWSGEAMRDCSMVDKPQQFPVCQAGVWGEAIRRREPLILNDYSATHEGKKGLPDGHVLLTNLLVVPSFSRGRIVAVAAVANRARDYGQEDVDQLTLFLASAQAIVDRTMAVNEKMALQARMDFALANGHIGGWDLDLCDHTAFRTLEHDRIFGYPELLPRWTYEMFLEHVIPEDREEVDRRFQQAIREQGDWRFECRIRRCDGEQRWILAVGRYIVSENGRGIRMAGIVRDVTEPKRAEEERARLEAANRHIQKTESLDRMAGAIAHHFNNQLQVVTGNLELAMDEVPEGGYLFDRLTAALRATRGASIVSGRMLTYLGQTVARREPVDLAEVCRRNLPMLRAALPKNVGLEFDLPTPGPAVTADEGQMEHVLTNMVVNASEASTDNQAAIQVMVKTVAVADIPTAHRFPVGVPVNHPAYACLQVADAGCGIAETDVEKLFDPFFSTKFTGRGMGLPVALGIVRAHDGIITVESELGRGSIFRVHIPLTTEVVRRAPQDVPATRELPECGTVLVVEDEDVVRDMVTVMLTRLGFTVLAAKNGVEAVDVFRDHVKTIVCVLLDLTMPRMNGWTTLTALRQIAPGVPVILASGYSEAQVMAGAQSERPQAFLAKPYRREQLCEAIRQATR